jgi:hypothetical protein
VTGRVERGIVKVGEEEIEIVGIADAKTTAPAWKCSKCSTKVKQATTSASLRGTKREDVQRGKCCASRLDQAHTHFEIYVLSKDEGGRHTPFFNNYRPTVLLPHDGRDRCDRVARRQRDGDARRQRVDHGQADQPDRDGRGLRFAMARRPYRWCWRCCQNHRVIPQNTKELPWPPSKKSIRLKAFDYKRSISPLPRSLTPPKRTGAIVKTLPLPTHEAF